MPTPLPDLSLSEGGSRPIRQRPSTLIPRASHQYPAKGVPTHCQERCHLRALTSSQKWRDRRQQPRCQWQTTTTPLLSKHPSVHPTIRQTDTPQQALSTCPHTSPCTISACRTLQAPTACRRFCACTSHQQHTCRLISVDTTIAYCKVVKTSKANRGRSNKETTQIVSISILDLIVVWIG